MVIILVIIPIAINIYLGNDLVNSLVDNIRLQLSLLRKVVKKMQLRNAEGCYTYDEIMEWVMEEYAGLCQSIQFFI